MQIDHTDLGDQTDRGDQTDPGDWGAGLFWCDHGEWRYVPTEDFTDVTLAIDDTYGDDVRRGDGGAGQGGWQGVR